MASDVLVNFEAGMTRAWHRDCGAPMARVTRGKSLEAENGDQLHLYECAGCGAMVLAGMSKTRAIVHHQIGRAPTSGSSLEWAAASVAILALQGERYQQDADYHAAIYTLIEELGGAKNLHALIAQRVTREYEAKAATRVLGDTINSTSLRLVKAEAELARERERSARLLTALGEALPELQSLAKLRYTDTHPLADRIAALLADGGDGEGG